MRSECREYWVCVMCVQHISATLQFQCYQLVAMRCDRDHYYLSASSYKSELNFGFLFFACATTKNRQRHMRRCIVIYMNVVCSLASLNVTNSKNHKTKIKFHKIHPLNMFGLLNVSRIQKGFAQLNSFNTHYVIVDAGILHKNKHYELLNVYRS